MVLPRRILLVVLTLSSFGCAALRPEMPSTPPPGGILRIGVEKPVNASGAELLQPPKDPLFEAVTGVVPQPTIIESLETHLRSQLQSRGFQVLTKNVAEVPVLRTEIRKWLPYQVDYSLVTVDVIVTLVDGKTGATIWSERRSNWNVPTHGQSSPFDAALEATRRVPKDLLESWTPAPDPTQAAGTAPEAEASSR